MIKLIKLLIEQHKFRKAMNILAKQEWSVDFLIYLLRKVKTKGIAIRIKEPSGKIVELIDTSEAGIDYYAKDKELNQAELDVALGIMDFEI